MDRMNDKLDALWAEYREACPDPEPAALTVIMGVVLIPQFQKALVYSSNYVDVLAADHPNTYVDILNGDIR